MIRYILYFIKILFLKNKQNIKGVLGFRIYCVFRKVVQKKILVENRVYVKNDDVIIEENYF